MNILGFIKMKYEQFIYREADRLNYHNSEDENKIDELEDKIYELDLKNDELFHKFMS